LFASALDYRILTGQTHCWLKLIGLPRLPEFLRRFLSTRLSEDLHKVPFAVNAVAIAVVLLRFFVDRYLIVTH